MKLSLHFYEFNLPKEYNKDISLVEGILVMAVVHRISSLEEGCSLTYVIK